MKSPKNVSSKNMKSPKKLLKSQKNDISKKIIKSHKKLKTKNFQNSSNISVRQCQDLVDVRVT